MPIKNYTTSVGFHRTINEVEKILGAHGATQVSKVLEEGDPVAIYFTIPFGDTPINIKKAPELPPQSQQVTTRRYAGTRLKPIKPVGYGRSV